MTVSFVRASSKRAVIVDLDPELRLRLASELQAAGHEAVARSLEGDSPSVISLTDEQADAVVELAERSTDDAMAPLALL